MIVEELTPYSISQGATDREFANAGVAIDVNEHRFLKQMARVERGETWDSRSIVPGAPPGYESLFPIPRRKFLLDILPPIQHAHDFRCVIDGTIEDNVRRGGERTQPPGAPRCAGVPQTDGLR